MRVGIDTQSVDAVAAAVRAFGDAYRRRVFTDGEVAARGGWGAPAERCAGALAECFAAKEAAVKALAPGADETVGWREIEVERSVGRGDRISLTGRAADLARRGGVTRLDLSTSRGAGVAVALVLCS